MKLTSKQTGGVLSFALFASAAALLAGFAVIYFASHLGQGVVTEAHKVKGIDAFSYSALDFFACQRVALAGSGSIPDQFGGTPQKVSATVGLPISIWAVVPAVVLMITGFVIYRRTYRTGVESFLAVMLLSIVFYALAAMIASRFVSAAISPEALPSFQGWEFNPPPVKFSPIPLSTLISCGIFAMVFIPLGAFMGFSLLPGSTQKDGWAASVKVTLIAAFIFTLIIAGALEAWILSERESSQGATTVVKMLPTLAGIGYAAIHGATLQNMVEARSDVLSDTLESVAIRVNLYTGVDVSQGKDKSHKLMPYWVYALAVLPALSAFLSGWHSVKRGSRDGSLPTALRVTTVWVAYTAFIFWGCRLFWNSQMVIDQGSASSSVAIILAPGISLIFLACVFIFSLLGAYIGRSRLRLASNL